MIEKIARRVLAKLAQEEIPLAVQALDAQVKEQLDNSRRMDYAKPASGAGNSDPVKSMPLKDSAPAGLSFSSNMMQGAPTDSATGKTEAPVSLKEPHTPDMPKLPKVGK